MGKRRQRCFGHAMRVLENSALWGHDSKSMVKVDVWNYTARIKGVDNQQLIANAQGRTVCSIPLKRVSCKDVPPSSEKSRDWWRQAFLENNLCKDSGLEV